MSILAECPICHRKQSAKNKKCACDEDLDKAKRAKKVKYWISYRMLDGKQRRESVSAFERLDPYSIKDARDAESKRIVQKREHRIFDMLPASVITFTELAKWYLDLKTVKKLASYGDLKGVLDNFNKEFGNWLVDTVKPVDLENYQEKRQEQGRAPATIDKDISIVKTMIIKAFDNDKIDGRVLKVFRSVKRKLRKGTNARKRIVSFDEYLRLIDVSQPHLKACIVIAFNTGMRTGEIRQLKWAYIDRKEGFIRLPAEIPKEKKEKNIPINHHVKNVLNSLPRALKHDFVITYKGMPITTPGGLKRSFKTTCKNAKIPCGRKVKNGIIFHDIRRTVKTNMTAAGLDKAHRDVILGHSMQGMDVHYIVPTEDTLKQEMARYTQWIDSQLADASSNVDHSVDQAAV
jgi:integrase